MPKLLLIDTFNFLHRAYHALPKTLTDTAGEPVNAVYGVTSMIITALTSVRPQYLAAAVDGEKPTFRTEDFTGYKAHRKPMETELSSQITKVFDVLDAFGIPRLQVDGFEADDILATVAKKFAGTTVKNNDGSKEPLDVILMSNDRDLWQLVSDHIMLMVADNKGGTDWLGYKEAEARLGFDPNKIAEYKGLRGDPSDNLPGVFGVGDVTAAKLINKYGSLDEIYKNVQEIEPFSLREKLLNCYEQAVMSRNLAKLIFDVPLEVTLDQCKFSDFNKSKVRDVMEKYRFKSLIRRLGFEPLETTKAKSKVNDSQLGLF